MCTTFLDLPPEVMSRICRYIGLDFDPRDEYEPKYDDRDLQALRLSCRELYFKTTYDTAVRYAERLDELEIFVDHQGLCGLLHLTRNPCFRDRIILLTLRWRTAKHELSWPSEDHWAAEIEQEKLDAFIESTEAVYLLAECFQDLKHTSQFADLAINDTELYSLVIAAMGIVKFPRRIATFKIQLQLFPGPAHRTLTINPTEAVPYTKGLDMLTSRPTNSDSSYKRVGEYMLASKSGNKCGYHIKGYRPCEDPGFLTALSDFAGVKSMKVGRCDSLPRLRLCDGCHTLFDKEISSTLYPNLKSLSLDAIYVSGGRLQRFIKQHSATITDLEFHNVSLTDVSWHSIAQGLQKLAELHSLLLRRLFQKRMPDKTRPKPSKELLHHRRDHMDYLYIKGGDNVQTFLQNFLQYFSARLVNHPIRRWRGNAPFPETYPCYYEVNVYRFAAVKEVSWRPGWVVIMKYAKEVTSPLGE